MQSMATIRLFEEAAHAAAYAAFRPTYPRSVLDVISSFIKIHSGSGFGAAVDVGCGSGQSTFFLSDLFQKVVGVDISAAQIANARAKCSSKEPPNAKQVEFRVGSAQELPVETSSVDLVTCAQAWHWLDPAALYAEARRVLRPRGCLAVYGYGNVRLANEKGQTLVSAFYDNLRQGGYWHQRREHIDNEYKDVQLPFAVTERHDLSMSSAMTLAQFTGYVSTWSGYCSYCEQHPGNAILEKLHEGLRSTLDSGTQGEDQRVDVSFPVFVIVGLKDL